MGHVRLGRLPASKPWREVVAAITDGDSIEEVAEATSKAAQAGFERAKRDPGFLEAFWLLTQLPIAARSPDFVAHLGGCGVDLDRLPSLPRLMGALTATLDAQLLSAPSRTDLSELSQLAFVETVARVVADRLPSLVRPTPNDVQAVLRGFGTVKEFGELTRLYFARLTERYLSYYLSRELSAHVGRDARFTSVAAQTKFNEDLARHCFEASRIVERFAGEWFSKTQWEQGTVDRDFCGRFAAYAFTKMGAELRRRDGAGRG